MIDCAVLATHARLVEPADAQAILQAQVILGCTFPEGYIALLRCSNGFMAKKIASLVLYAIEELEERNITYEVQEYLPGWLIIGDDGGGRGIFINCNDKSDIPYLLELGSMLLSDAMPLASDLTSWGSQGLSLG